MQNDTALRPGFVPVQRAIELIQEDTREKAVVDLQFLVNNIPYMKVRQNFNIRLLKTTPEGKVVRNGSVNVTLMSEFDRQILLKAIQEAYSQRTGILVNPETYGLNRVTTTIDQEKGFTTGAPRPDIESDTKFKDPIADNTAQQVIQGV